MREYQTWGARKPGKPARKIPLEFDLIRWILVGAALAGLLFME